MAGPGLQTDFGRTPALPGGPWPWRAVLGFVGAWDSEGTGPCLPWAPIPGPSVSTETRVAMAHTTSLGRGKPSAGGGRRGAQGRAPHLSLPRRCKTADGYYLTKLRGLPCRRN